MTRDTIYDRLREIGCSVETSDATAEALEGMSDRKIDAFIMWATGIKWDAISKILRMSTKDISYTIATVLNKCNVFICNRK